LESSTAEAFDEYVESPLEESYHEYEPETATAATSISYEPTTAHTSIENSPRLGISLEADRDPEERVRIGDEFDMALSDVRCLNTTMPLERYSFFEEKFKESCCGTI
jgi:hypothetical protein